MSSVTKWLDKIRNKCICGNLGITNIAGKTRENLLRWFGHIKRKNDDEIFNKICEIRLGRNCRGRVGRRKSEWRCFGKSICAKDEVVVKYRVEGKDTSI